MEPKHKELLDQWHQNLLDSITDADRLIELLILSGTLSQLDRFELDQNCSSCAEKVDHLLKMLVNKESDHFLELCVALEKTYPELYSALFSNGGGPVDHSSGSTYSVLSTMPSDSESSSSLSSVGSPPGTGNGSASSPPLALNDNRPAGDNLDTILFQLRHVTRERDELRKRLALASPGTTFDECRPNSKASHDYERLKSQCMRAMADLQSLQNQHTKTLKRCEEAVKEADFYHMLHSRVLGDQSQLKEELEVLRRDTTQLVREHNHLKQSCEELRRLHSEDQKEVADMRLQQQEVMRENGSSEVLNKLYDTAMDKLEGVRKEYDSLSKRYGEKVANHNTDLSRLEQVEEENRRLQKQMDMLLKQRDKAIHYQQQCSTSMRRFDSVQQELDKSSTQNKELQREMERLQSEVTRCKNFQLKAVKDCEKYKEERDSVIKELDKLQTELEAAEARLKNTSSERMVASEEMEALRQELNSSLVDRDRSICERNELLEKYCHEVKDKAEAQKELSQACKDIETVREERDVARKERTEAIIQREQLLRECYQARQVTHTALTFIIHTCIRERTEAIIQREQLLREYYQARPGNNTHTMFSETPELKEATQEAEVAKCRRDWAFQERDKIVAERESIRTLCDNLRRERDRAVSDLADALRNLDDMRKQKNDASRELKELNSHDSAIDTDSLEWETEVVEFEKDRDDMDLKALGFDIAEGVNDPYLPGDCGIFVTRVDRGSIADGRLRVNDWLLKLNDVDVTNKDRKQVVKAVLNGGWLINMVVRRRKSLGGRLVTPIHINLIGHKDSGIGLESGVFVTALVQGSPAAREGSLTVGDRLIAINGIALDNKSVTECETLLRNCRESLSLSLMKFFPHSSSGQSIFESLRESSSNGRLSEVHFRNSLKHNSSTQTDIFCPDTRGGGSNVNVPGERRKGGVGEPDEGMEVYGDIRKPFSMGSLHSTSLRPSSDLGLGPPGRYGPSAFQECCSGSPYAKAPPPPMTYDPSNPPDCITMETTLERKHSGGTWPKMIVGGMSVAVDTTTAMTPTQLSIFKSPKQRKSIFDPDAFKSRPETAPQSSKMEYLSPSQLVAHSPQPSKTESPSSTATPTPPTPPTRSDSFKFKHKQQSSSASDCTLTSDGGKGEAVAMVMGEGSGERERERERERDRNGNHYFLDGKVLTSRKSCDEDIGRTRGEEPEVKRPRPKSAPALRRRMTPQSITLPSFQSYSNDDHSPEPREMLRSSPNRSHRHSVGFVPTVYNGTLPANSAHRGLAPCPAVTAVMRNPVYTVRSHRVHTNNCPSVSSQISADYSSSSSRSSSTSHGTNSLPSSARLGLGWSSKVQYRTERIKVPSTPRYPRSMLGSDRGSLSHSECSSPSLITPPHSPLNLETSSFASSQSQSSISTLPRISVSPVPIGERRKDRSLYHNRSFLRIPLAARPRFSSLRSLRPYLEEPRNVIVHKGAEPLGISIVGGENGGIFVSKVTGGSIAHQAGLEYGDQLLEYNGINLRNATEQQARLIIGQQCDTITIMAQYNPHMYQLGNPSRSSGATTPDNHSTIDTLSEQDEGTLTPSSKQTTPTTSPHSFSRVSSEGSCKVCEPRVVTVRRAQGTELGLGLCGGNLRGVYVESLEEDSPARGPEGLQPGDLILEYGSVNMKNKTVEEVYVEMLKPAETVTLRVQQRPDDFNMVKDTPGDGFYIRALYERTSEAELDLSFQKDDILYEFYRRHSMTELKDDKDGKSLSAAARRSFFRRKHKHKRSGSKDGKELVAQDAISTDSIPFLEDPVKDMLVKESPRKFCRCVLEVMKASQQAIERGVKDCLFIDYKRRNIAPHAIERLHSVHIYPIVIFIRYKNAKQIKKLVCVCVCVCARWSPGEQKDPVYLRDKVSQKHSKEQFEVAQKIEQEYSTFFTGIVQGGTLPYICTQIMTIVDQEQSKRVEATTAPCSPWLHLEGEGHHCTLLPLAAPRGWRPPLHPVALRLYPLHSQQTLKNLPHYTYRYTTSSDSSPISIQDGKKTWERLNDVNPPLAKRHPSSSTLTPSLIVSTQPCIRPTTPKDSDLSLLSHYQSRKRFSQCKGLGETMASILPTSSL
ncbi:unnamed protein product, partial [Coregonus sp. 'balchen']